MINVLLADDSGFMRLLLSDILAAEQDIKITSTAQNGKEALEKVLSDKPDVVLLDMIMPDYDGMYAVRNIMKESPTPIVILSALGNTNLGKVFEALDEGACDFITKPGGLVSSNIRGIDKQIIEKIKQASYIKVDKLLRKKGVRNGFEHTFDSVLPYDVLILGASTGGTGALEEIMLKLPANFPLPIVVIQHMPKEFIESFSRRLNGLLPFTVKIAGDNEPIRAGHVYMASTEGNLKIKQDVSGRVVFKYTDEKFPEFNFPSVDCTMLSASEVFKNRAISVILTGMGKDGANGMMALHKAGSFTIAQDEKTCVVYGMPRAAYEAGAVNTVLPVYEIPGYIVSCLS
jgi:two-component system chemotaxis response regulator CheB